MTAPNAFDPARRAERLRAMLPGAAAEILLKAGADALAPSPDAPALEHDDADPGARAAGLAMLEAAFLVAAADGELTENESASLVEAVVSVTGGGVGRARIARLLGTFAELLARDGFRERLRRVAASLPDASARRAAFTLALTMLLTDESEPVGSDHDITQAVLVALARALGLTHDVTKDLAARWLHEVDGVAMDEARTQIEVWDVESPVLPDDEADAMVDALSARMLRGRDRDRTTS